MKSSGENRITKWDFGRVFLRSSFEQGSWNYERMHNLGFEFILVPVISRLFPKSTDRSDAMKRHLDFFNTTPIMQSLITGVTINLEEQVADGSFDPKQINQVKTALMGPLASFGDPLWWIVLRPTIAAIAIELCMSKWPILGPIFFFIIWNIIRLGFRFISQLIGYQRGLDILGIVQSPIIKNVIKGSSVFGMFLMGVLIARFVRIDICGFTSQSFTKMINFSPMTFASALISIGLTLSSIWLLRKRVNMVWIMLMIVVICIGMSLVGIIR
ncbi:PTS system mannose/fructose/sorbose family transporter subunit IID [Lentilactobacillus sp. SPB1-3]|uniref:PTS system mannose/fructose/sorbose family transporter subunit IID n=1 Tax=Lentilactobacillus terminaliae TaxID=3003483 RepID=A0ACD5DGW2_9LACO|nr:PTS system mannose/fructose/sorbose family transporter subunit IID [Lentilactobacillus sp. SPB1-3]MCZ0976876.1 PTS system mannose/fructose/sorbose family transporter subunit IID [Lentilactobacillus sp. SPB1-3]